MIKAVGVQFVSGIKAYDFNPGSFEVKNGDKVLVETTQGKEVGKVVYVGKEIQDKKNAVNLKEIIKVLNEKELSDLKESKKNAEEDFERIAKLIVKFNIPIRPLLVEYSTFEDRVDIYFSSEGRVDFRNAVKELSRTLGKTVKLRQVGSRDQAKIIGGFGPCGREVCCKKFLFNTGGITKEMAEKITGARNLSKMLGVCGNLMCCLLYEQKKVSNEPDMPAEEIIKVEKKEESNIISKKENRSK